MPTCRFCERSVPPGTDACLSCGAPLARPSGEESGDLEVRVRSLLAQGQKLSAVKIYKAQMSVTLMEAKTAVEALGRGESLPSRERVDGNLEAEVLGLLGRDEKLQAVKLYRKQAGCTLMEAKQAVEALAARHGIEVSQGTGCAAVVVLAVLLAVAVMIGVIGVMVLVR